VGIGQPQALAGELVEVRGADSRVRVLDREIAVAHVIGVEEDDIGPAGGGGSGRGGSEGGEEEGRQQEAEAHGRWRLGDPGSDQKRVVRPTFMLMPAPEA
jgi:hypothetical protein